MQQDIQITSAPVPTQEAGASCCGGACCGGGAADSTSAAEQTFEVEGMTCGHCSSAVSTEIGAITGVRGVRIDVVAGGRSTVRVDADRPLDVELVRSAVDEAGYTLV